MIKCLVKGCKYRYISIANDGKEEYEFYLRHYAQEHSEYLLPKDITSILKEEIRGKYSVENHNVDIDEILYGDAD